MNYFMKNNLFSIKPLLIILLIFFASCEKDDDLTPVKPTATTTTTTGGDDPVDNPNPTNMDLMTAHPWVMYHVKLNNNVVTNTGTDVYLWERDGDHFDTRQTNGTWKHSGRWSFANIDSTNFTMFTGLANMQYWRIQKLTDEELEVNYSSSSGSFFFKFRPE